MIAKVIIKRKFIKNREKEIISLLNKVRSVAMNQPGYISGETLMQSETPQNMTVISTWKSMALWQQWKSNPERKQLEAMLEVYQEGPTVYEEYLLGTPLS
jgi:heme-degrading monooxygenase HmoA